MKEVRTYRNYYLEGSEHPTNFLKDKNGGWWCTHGDWAGVEVEGAPTHLKHAYGVAMYDSFEQYTKTVDVPRVLGDFSDFDDDIAF